MRTFNKPQWIALFAASLFFTYFASGLICILINSSKISQFFKVANKHYDATFTITMIEKHYPYALESVGIAFVISVVAILVLMFFPEKESLHGAARFANYNDIKKMGLFSEKGIIVGKRDGKLLRFKGQQFVSVGAPTRSGKGVGIVIPNLLEWQDSCVVQDIKQECYDYTSGYRQKVLKQDVYLFNPFSPDRTHRYNPLSYIDMNSSEADLQLTGFANILYPTAGADSTTVFFNQLAQNLFIGLCQMNKDIKSNEEFYEALMAEGITIPFTMKGILELSEGFTLKGSEGSISGFAETFKFLKEQNILSDECVKRLESYFKIDSENTRSGVMSSFNAPLLMFRSKTMNAATEESDFDFRDLRKKRMTIYVGITPDQLANAKLILNIFWSQLILVNTKELPQTNPSVLKYPCLLLMDEFTAPGAIEVLEKPVSFIAGYNLRFLIIFQSISQLESRKPNGYDKEGAKTILTNISCQILYAPRDQEDAERFSKLLGNKTVKSGSKSFGKGGASRSESETHRALMLPQELRELPFEEEVITIDSGKPIKCKKAIYHSDSYFMDKFKLVATSLKGIKGIPQRQEFEGAIAKGECRMEEKFMVKRI